MMTQFCKIPSVLVDHGFKHPQFLRFRHHVPAKFAARRAVSSCHRQKLLRFNAEVDDAPISLDVPEPEDARGAIAVRSRPVSLLASQISS